MKAVGNSVGRRHREPDDTILKDPFLLDYFKIIQSKSYRRMQYKTQVITAPDNPHIRTRLVHTNEVIALSLAISEALGLKKTLCQSIAAGHDIGHTPYGHLGEKVLTDFSRERNKEEKPFNHHIYSVVVAQHIERKGSGLNLSFETLEGIMYHSGFKRPECEKPEEYFVVMYADTIAYTLADLNDALRYGYFEENEVPDYKKVLGDNPAKMTQTVIDSLVEESRAKDKVIFSEGEAFEKFNELRDFLFERFYCCIDQKLNSDVLYSLCDFFSGPDFRGVDPVILVSLLTDYEANKFGSLMLESKQPSVDRIQNFGVFEILPYLEGKKIDYTEPDLGWENERRHERLKE